MVIEAGDAPAPRYPGRGEAAGDHTAAAAHAVVAFRHTTTCSVGGSKTSLNDSEMQRPPGCIAPNPQEHT